MKNNKETFYNKLQKHSWDDIKKRTQDYTEKEVIEALNHSKPTIDHFGALISKAALPYLEEMAYLSQQKTQQRFGKTMQLYIPMYLSNYCSNGCIYCGFNAKNDIPRKRLDVQEITEEADHILKLGIRNLLLVTGEDNRNFSTKDLVHAVKILVPLFDQISIEVQPMSIEDYKTLNEAGVHSVYVYQETYNELIYPDYHPFGQKRKFQYRLETPERIAEAGIHKVGLGVLLGLDDWRTEAILLAGHLHYLEKHYWKTVYSLSFPRLRPNEGHFEPKNPISDTELLQLICAFRIYNPFVELALSTRESAFFRDHLISLGITSMSAGSKTEPGGYSHEDKALKQFEIEDSRTVDEVVKSIQQAGYEAVWKDWDHILSATTQKKETYASIR
ncbi:2-iminoacetate synthase ThiH [Halosquirtibacter laminarini]|uniref:2-iminoacetate synthase ThiH n=1 Tax=Halosquirtibacter laminarini TaxID=3374600 RepID=A0AC61NP90_9BACT|nr:2-iminoacetate synthase ThiH [Prolixibacteraceae bacterium]